MLSGMTLESIVVVKRLTKALRRRAERGLVDMDKFPLLAYIDGVLEYGEYKEFPWDKFTFENI